MNEAKEVVNKLHHKHCIAVKPYVIIYGQSLDKITSSFVVLGDHMYQVTTPLIAVDVCFQSVETIGDEFSIVCNHIWQFLEKAVYQFDITSPYSGVSDLINTLRDVSVQ